MAAMRMRGKLFPTAQHGVVASWVRDTMVSVGTVSSYGRVDPAHYKRTSSMIVR